MLRLGDRRARGGRRALPDLRDARPPVHRPGTSRRRRLRRRALPMDPAPRLGVSHAEPCRAVLRAPGRGSGRALVRNSRASNAGWSSPPRGWRPASRQCRRSSGRRSSRCPSLAHVRRGPAAAPGLEPRRALGLRPQQVAEAYGFDAVGFGSISGDGSGQTIAIVDAYDDPALVDSTAPNFGTSDLAQFDRRSACPTRRASSRSRAGGPTACRAPTRPGPACPGTGRRRRRWTWSGPTPWPRGRPSSWSKATRPSADLYPGRRRPPPARRLGGLDELGVGRVQRRGALRRRLHHPGGHQGVTFVAATGDTGARALPGLFAERGGGRRHDADAPADGTYGGEIGWTNGGGGTSIARPSRPTRRASRRPASGRSPTWPSTPTLRPGSRSTTRTTTRGDGPWIKIGGTSLAAPAWAALIAIADQGRVAAGGATLDGAGPDPAGPLLPAGRRLPRHHDRGQRRLLCRARLRRGDRAGQPVGRLVALRWPITTCTVAGDQLGPADGRNGREPFAMTSRWRIPTAAWTRISPAR